jgi:hypothetical protein
MLDLVWWVASRHGDRGGGRCEGGRAQRLPSLRGSGCRHPAGLVMVGPRPSNRVRRARLRVRGWSELFGCGALGSVGAVVGTGEPAPVAQGIRGQLGAVESTDEPRRSGSLGDQAVEHCQGGIGVDPAVDLDRKAWRVCSSTTLSSLRILPSRVLSNWSSAHTRVRMLGRQPVGCRRGDAQPLAFAPPGRHAPALLTPQPPHRLAIHRPPMLAELRVGAPVPVGMRAAEPAQLFAQRPVPIRHDRLVAFGTAVLPDQLTRVGCQKVDRRAARSCVRASSHDDRRMTLRLPYLLFRQVVNWLGLLARSSALIARGAPCYIGPTFAGSAEVGGADADVITGGLVAGAEGRARRPPPWHSVLLAAAAHHP